MSARLFGEPELFPGQDPWVVPYGGSYLLVQSVANNRRIAVRQFRHPTEMAAYDEHVVWAPPPDSDHGRQLWAPELHLVDGWWYLYFAASDGRIRNHRMYAVRSAHPFGPYREVGRVFDPAHDLWSIDMTVLRHAGRLYAIWSSWEDGGDGTIQNLYIAPMADPWTISGERRLLSRPEHGWEMTDGAVNEGPEVLRNPDTGRLFVVYSADASWTHAYKLGVLEWLGGDVLDPGSWRKLDRPILLGGGHASFVETPEGGYVIYHRKLSADPGWADRELRWERYGWDEEGYPFIGRAGRGRRTSRPTVERRKASVGFPSAAATSATVAFVPHRVPRPPHADR